jgi:hypothetical protein
VAVQTPWTEKFLDYYEDSRPRVLTGPLLYSVASETTRRDFRREMVGDNRQMRIVVHATTQKSRTGFRFHITETLDEYISTLGDMVKAVNELEDVFLVIRPHPVCELSEQDFWTLLPRSEKVRIVRKGPFASVLSIADLVVSYSSTCIEEALQNRIPVLLYDPWDRYNHFNVDAITDGANVGRRPVFYLTRPELLRESLRKIIGHFSQTPLQDEELTLYRYGNGQRNNFYSFVSERLQERETCAGCKPLRTVGILPRSRFHGSSQRG